MDSIARTAGRLGVTTLAGAALVMAPSYARARTSGAAIIAVPCNSSLLANAILTANTTPATLRLAPHCIYDITGQLPQITGNVTLVGGPSTTIRHDPGTAANYRLLDVASTGTLRVVAVFLRNGNPAGDGGAIRNAGRLVLDAVTLGGNVAGNVVAPTGGNGGAVANLPGGRAVIARTAVIGNSATSAPAETTTGNGGGIYNAGSLTVSVSRVAADNAASASAAAGTGNGGGIATVTGGRTLVLQSTVVENTATRNGGGIFNAGTTSVDRSLVLRNRAASGGGIFGTVTVRGSAVRGNVPDNCVPANPACG